MSPRWRRRERVRRPWGLADAIDAPRLASVEARALDATVAATASIGASVRGLAGAIDAGSRVRRRGENGKDAMLNLR